MLAASAWASCVCGISEPEVREGVGGHPPVAPRRQGDRADLRAVRKAAPLELLREEPLEEDFKPLQEGFSFIALPEGLLREEEYLSGRTAEAEEVVEEEVMELVRADEVLGQLSDRAVLGCGSQFRTDRGVNYIGNYFSCSASVHFLPSVKYFLRAEAAKLPDESLGDG